MEVCGISTDQQLQHELCVRCGEAPSVPDQAYCGHCFWQIRAEIEDGMHALRAYLANWREFRDWEAGDS